MLPVRDVQRSADFWRELGMREIERTEEIAIMELRGGTHLLLLGGTSDATEGVGVPFDLMVDDLEVRRDRPQPARRRRRLPRLRWRGRVPPPGSRRRRPRAPAPPRSRRRGRADAARPRPWA
jgi:catechol 2,3-dioxygenase-like lactoylglutathione lyase family enzyme